MSRNLERVASFRRRIAAVISRLEEADSASQYQEKVALSAEAIGRLSAAREEFGADWPAMLYRWSEGKTCRQVAGVAS